MCKRERGKNWRKIQLHAKHIPTTKLPKQNSKQLNFQRGNEKETKVRIDIARMLAVSIPCVSYPITNNTSRDTTENTIYTAVDASQQLMKRQNSVFFSIMCR